MAGLSKKMERTKVGEFLSKHWPNWRQAERHTSN